MIIKDQLNREIYLKEVPKRIISLVPSQTELLVDLGLRDAIVGVTKFCIHPNHLRKEKTIVGGTKQVNFEKIKSLQPDVILCNKEENTIEMVEQLNAIAPVHISDINSLNDCYELINSYGNIFKLQSNALTIVNSIKNERLKFQEDLKKSTKKVAYFIWKDPWMVAASHTFIDCMLTEASFKNTFKDLERYPEITLEDEKLLAADVIFLSSEPFPFKQKHVDFLSARFPDKEILIVDGEMFSWYGSRLIKAYQYFRNIIS